MNFTDKPDSVVSHGELLAVVVFVPVNTPNKEARLPGASAVLSKLAAFVIPPGEIDMGVVDVQAVLHGVEPVAVFQAELVETVK